jgi:hypothetical protein
MGREGVVEKISRNGNRNRRIIFTGVNREIKNRTGFASWENKAV